MSQPPKEVHVGAAPTTTSSSSGTARRASIARRRSLHGGLRVAIVERDLVGGESASDARAHTNAGLDPCVLNHLLIANLETRGVVSRSAPFPISAELRFGMNPGGVPTPTSARDGAC